MRPFQERPFNRKSGENQILLNRTKDKIAESSQRRVHSRENCEVPILFSPAGSDRFHRAVMRNYSLGGVYFESRLALSKGMSLFVKTDSDNAPEGLGNMLNDIRPAEVRWCMTIADSEPPRYGCGIQYCMINA